MAKYAWWCNLSEIGHALCEIVIKFFIKDVAEIPIRPGRFVSNLRHLQVIFLNDAVMVR
jgi:hypothetical protein